MTTQTQRLTASLAAFSAALMLASASAGAMQPEPQMMFESGSSLSAVPVAATMAGPLPALRETMGKMGPMHGDGPRVIRGDPPLFPPFIRLTGEQEDKLFDLRHAQEPALRAQMKNLHSAHAQLRTLAFADNYDEAKVKETAASASQASIELAVMRARLQHAAYLLLTPEQRARLDQCKPGADGAPARDCLPPPR